MIEPTIERRALDALLASHPWFDVLAIDWQLPTDNAHGLGPRVEAGPWLLVTLGQRSDDGAHAWAHTTYAIWKRTGAVHALGADGAVLDPPLIPANAIA